MWITTGIMLVCVRLSLFVHNSLNYRSNNIEPGSSIVVSLKGFDDSELLGVIVTASFSI